MPYRPGRVLDATGKYPTGMLRWSRSDIGAFDECIATVVRDSYGNEISHGQYCNLLVYVKKSATWEKTIEPLLNIMHPKNLNHGVQPKKELRSLITAVKAFSLVTNTRMLLRTAKRSDGDHYALQFLHGLRFFSLVHIVLGHCYETITDTTGTLMNILILSDRWLSMLIAAAFNSVETFFFLSGFFLCLTVGKRKANPMVIFIMGALRRVIRICVPLFFIIMCLCLLPVIVTGPDTKSFYQKLYVEVSSQWWHYVLQIRNFYELGTQHVLGHTWYLSADFQLFVVSLLTLALLQGKLSFGVYLIHYPFIELLLHSSRERMHWSDFNQVTMLFSVLDWSFILAYFSYLACEAPTAALDKLAFSKLTGGGRARKQKRRTEVNEDSASPEKKKEDVFSRC
ncbi:hypothetical protein HPB52_006930 [Rhipicephalus sanguineus]|uniref:Acyltransferase 3 domain-containing protein n=1 Tax=Rhipicephalus sanguineus TaxID=34632 RepID=A0A9D4QGZ3_RHISA|nr:hypothetical protein HPB52_006930 [Rhipicephalus sanguineus]